MITDTDARNLLVLLRNYFRGCPDENPSMTCADLARDLLTSLPSSEIPPDTLWLAGERV